ncbi:membrane protein insertase YidC [Candidatus Poribacteria bacterium]
MDKRFLIAIALIFLVIFILPQLTKQMFGTKETDREQEYLLFSADDLKDRDSLISKLKEPQGDPLAQYLREERLDAETRRQLYDYDSSEQPSELLLEALVRDLNGMLKSGESLYDARRFEHVNLKKETEKLIEKNPEGEDLILLNRMLLDDVYPREATRRAKPIVVQGKESESPTSEPETPPQMAPPQAAEEKTIQTPLYELKLTTEGARAINWKLRDYPKRTRDSEAEPEYIDLVPPTATKCLTIEFNDPEIQDELEGNPVWTSDDEAFTEITEGVQDSVQFDYPTSAGMDISKKMTFFPDSYVVDIDIVLRNRSLEEMELGGYKLYWGAGIAKDGMIKVMDVAREGPVALVRTEDGQDLVRHWGRSGFACFGKNIRSNEVDNAAISWVGFASKYFVAALIPGPDPWWSDPGRAGNRYEIVTDRSHADILPPAEIWTKWGGSTTIALIQPKFSIAPGATVSHQFRVYVGPKKWDILRSVEGRDGATEPLGLGKMINFGMFSPLGKATLWMLKTFYRVVNNYGIALIFLTILIKILYFPLTQKSFKSMKKMQGLQPKIAALKEKHRDDPQRLQKETMKLYKQQGVNPMGGCLPMLFQLPVFWALFATLRGAVELRGAVFIPGWINDLSLSDTVGHIGGFPVNILPLIMTGTMLLQQLLFSPGSQGQGNKMMAFMPLMFAVFFYGMPSGLVLYWTCNNVLAIGHQYLIRRQDDTTIEDQLEEKGKKTRTYRK